MYFVGSVTIRPVTNVQNPRRVTVVRADLWERKGTWSSGVIYLKFSLFHSPMSVAQRAVKQSDSSSNVNMLVFSNTWGNMCKHLYISV